jgi:hypothetical protein
VQNQTTSFLPVEGFGSGAYSAKLLTGTRQRLSGFSHARQCGEVVLRIFVTGKPPARGGGGMPQRIMIISLGICIPDDRRRKIGKHAGHRRQVADLAVHHPEKRDDGSLVGRNRIEIAHRDPAICHRVSRGLNFGRF